MIKKILLLVFSIPCIFFQSCNTNAKVREATLIADSTNYILPIPKSEKKEILSSPVTKHMVQELNTFYSQKLGRYFNGSMLVAKKGVIVFEKYEGYTNLKKKIPINENTTFQLASTSKPFTAMAILWLQQKGKLNINDPIQKYIPKFPYQGITLKMLMSHRSGLPNYLYFCDSLWPDKSNLMTNQQVIDLMIKYHPKINYLPNTHFEYCNTNFCILAYVVEKVSGEKFGTFLKNIFFKPLGMKHTFVYYPFHPLMPTQSVSYNDRGIPTPNVCSDGVVGDKNVYSTVRDLLKWDRALYSGKLFTQQTLDAAFTPYSNEHPGIKNYGLGWRLLVYPDGEKIVYHNGWWHGNTSVFYRFIKDSTTLIILSNRFNREVYQVQPIWKILHEFDGAPALKDE
ncbi:MAG: serine hydrolase domain-containing protein [Chitinophagaceae bacterium]